MDSQRLSPHGNSPPSRFSLALCLSRPSSATALGSAWICTQVRLVLPALPPPPSNPLAEIPSALSPPPAHQAPLWAPTPASSQPLSRPSASLSLDPRHGGRRWLSTRTNLHCARWLPCRLQDRTLTGTHIPVFIVDLVSKARGVDDSQLHFDTTFLYHWRVNRKGTKEVTLPGGARCPTAYQPGRPRLLPSAGPIIRKVKFRVFSTSAPLFTLFPVPGIPSLLLPV